MHVTADGLVAVCTFTKASVIMEDGTHKGVMVKKDHSAVPDKDCIQMLLHLEHLSVPP